MGTETDGIPLWQNIDWGWAYIAGIAVLLLAFVTALTSAISPLTEKKLEKYSDDSEKDTEGTQKILASKERFVVGMQVITVVILMFVGAVAGHYAVVIPNKLITAATVVVTVILTAIIGILIPEKLVYKKNEETSVNLAGIIRFLLCVFTPISIVLGGIAKLVAGMFNPNLKETHQEVTEEEIKLMVDEGGEKGYIDEAETKMINNIFQFNDTAVNKIMTHRTDMVALDVTTPFEDVIKAILEEGYTRIPVYDTTLDNIVGILHAKAVVGFLNSGNKDNFDIREYLIKPYFIPKSKKADELFSEMQESKIHMAIVVDEYGGTSGIITMEDLIESILGNIQDEYDDEVEETVALGDDTYIAEGSAEFISVCETLGIELEEDDEQTADYETLGAFVTGMLDKIPENGDSFVFEDFVFEVTDADDKKINQVSIKKQEIQEEETK